MLPLPEFTVHTPASVDEAVALLAKLGPGAMLLAGGTDLLPNMKQGLHAPAHVVSLQRLGALRGVRREGDALVIGAMTTLDAVAGSAEAKTHAAALAEAAAVVGGPQHRRMGTLGGNLCLDTRCRYYNQTAFWRGALGYCLKKDGDTCHVVEGGRKCVAAASNDTAAAAIALEATVVLTGPAGIRRLPAADFFVADGARNTARREGELLTALEVPVRAGRVSVYEKLRRRGAIDFPLLSVAVRLDREDGSARALDVVISALAAKPRRLAAAQKLGAADLATLPIDTLADAALRECNPLPNIEGDVVWRKQMVRVLVKRALGRATSLA
ncbi:MAG: FAD binding domain-containing protein [Myxococcaceae bacterium]|nr:FAD binding domain-containing protein [Myxococcaceae bacterium]